jgi:hypothetical protein
MSDFLSHVINQLGGGGRTPQRHVIAGAGAGQEQVTVHVASAAAVRMVQVRRAGGPWGSAALCGRLLPNAAPWSPCEGRAYCGWFGRMRPHGMYPWDDRPALGLPG